MNKYRTMKKYIMLVIISLSFTVIHSQNSTDAMRLSQTDQNGTARFRAMSGAFGALGGDFSSITVNPAGSAIFMNNQLGFTLSNFNIKNRSNYFGNSTSDKSNAIDINQAGVVFVFIDPNPKNNWKKITFAINYENNKNLKNASFSSGINPNNSIDNYFLSYANANAQQYGIPLGILENNNFEDLNYEDRQAFLGYKGSIIKPDQINPSNNKYVSNIPTGGNYSQKNYLESTGYNGKLSFNLATQFKDKLYFGLNVNSHFTDYTQSTSFYETNNNSSNSGVKKLQFNNDLHTFGTGFSFQLGTIVKITKEFRAGLAYESSTWFKLNDELSQNLISTGFNYGNPPDPNLSTTASPGSNIIMVFQPYTLKTPGKWTGSLAYVFGKRGLISVDYALKNYSATKFTPKNEFQTANTEISNSLTTSGELRIGGEYKIKQWSLRAGFRNEQSPYKDGKTIGDLTGYSGGLGYNFGATKLDLAYATAHRSSQQSYFSQGFTDGATIKSRNNNITLTLLFEL